MAPLRVSGSSRCLNVDVSRPRWDFPRLRDTIIRLKTSGLPLQTSRTRLKLSKRCLSLCRSGSVLVSYVLFRLFFLDSCRLCSCSSGALSSSFRLKIFNISRLKTSVGDCSSTRQDLAPQDNARARQDLAPQDASSALQECLKTAQERTKTSRPKMTQERSQELASQALSGRLLKSALRPRAARRRKSAPRCLKISCGTFSSL
ncbi:hypothetical protein DFH08DRAFT_1072741 [Mycena albidolilacea]|uniref:Uncharacterized protein n=1 Tax=Mycena albidolilacea TaxID=1033008 RepID=A0AAD7F3R2_9AGAR|nr:hypothetical protein DFH08DRAFT_1072741 [Mycena albidolilacea]